MHLSKDKFSTNDRVMKLLRFFFIIALLFSAAGIYAQANNGYVFVVKIAPSWRGLVTYYEAFYNGRSFSETKALTKRQFVLRAAGLERSLANPQAENLWYKYGIDLPVDRYNKAKIKNNYMVNQGFPTPPVVDSLWKLRFAVYPYKTESLDTLGWTGNFKNPYVPTHAQKVILARMGMDTTFYTIFGDNLFHLLKAMQDPQWIAKYKNAAYDDTTSTGTY